MANILYRGSSYTTANTAGSKNAPLTNDEIDRNFYSLDSLKFDKAGGTVSGDTTFSTNVTISGNLTVNGTSTTINTTTLNVDDINIELGAVTSPSNATAAGGGITLLAGTDGNKTITWDTTNANWTSSEHWNIANGKKYKINNVDVLTSTTLGSGVTNSSLTKLGTTAGFVKSDASGNLSSDTTTYLSGTVGIANGGTNITSYAAGDILYASAANVLSKLAKGTDGQVLKLSGGFPTWGTDTDTVYSLPLAASGTRGGVQVGYTTAGKNYAVQLDGEKMYVNVPWTDTDTNTITTIGVGTAVGVSGDVKLVAGSNVTISRSGQDITITSSYTDTNTWNANALNVAGYVAAPISSTANLVWKTDGNGNPAWRADSDTTYSAGTGLSLSGTTFSVSYGTTSTTACVGNDSRLSDSRAASDVYAWAKAATKPSYTASEVGAAPASHTHSYLPLSGGTLSGTLFLGGNSANLLNGTTNNGAGGLRARITANENTTSPAGYNSGGSTADGTLYLEVEHGDVGGFALGADGATLYNSGDRGYLLRIVQEDSWQLTGPSYIAGDPGTQVSTGVPVRFLLTAAGALKIASSFTAGGDVTAYSDARLKTNISIIENALDKVTQINGYTFDRTDIEGSRKTGVIAQEVLKVLPEAVSENEDKMYTVAYGNLVGLLIEAIKELNAKVEDLQNQLANK